MSSPASQKFAIGVFNALANARTQHGGVLPRENWLDVVAEAFEKTRPKAAKAAKITGPGLSEEDWLAGLEQAPVYAGIDVRRELGKCQMWAGTKGRKVSRMRFINWLNKAEVPVNGHSKPAAALSISNEPKADWRKVAMRLFPTAAEWITPHDFKAMDWANVSPTIREEIIKALRSSGQ